MDRTLQDKFIGVFELGGFFGVARWVKDYHDNGISLKQEKDETDEDYQLRLAHTKSVWDAHYKQEEDKLTRFIDEGLDFELLHPQRPLMREVEECLSCMGNIDAQKRYITSIIIRLKDISDILYPNTTHTDFEDAISWAKERAEKYHNLYQETESDNDSVEIKAIKVCLSMFYTLVNMLDAVCLPFRIDIEELQNDTEVRLRSHRDFASVAVFVGSHSLTAKYLKELTPQEPTTNPTEPQIECGFDAPKSIIALANYFSGVSAADFSYIIQHHSLPDGVNRVKWCGIRVDAWRFQNRLSWGIKAFNGVFEIASGPLLEKNKDKNGVSDNFGICKLLKSLGIAQ